MSNKMKRIGMILDKKFPPDPRVNNEAMALLKQGHEIWLFCIGETGQKKSEIINGIVVERFFILPDIYKKIHALVYTFPIFQLILRKPIRKFINSRKFDVIHVHDMIIASVALAEAKRAKVKTILDLHENRPAIMPLYSHVNSGIGKLLINVTTWKNMQIELVNKADKVIVVTPEAKRDLLKISHKSSEDIISVPNSVEAEHFTSYTINPQISSKYKEKFVILYLGNTGLRRGTDLAIKSVKIMEKLGMKNFTLLLVGGSRDNAYLKKMIKMEKVESFVEMTDWQDETLFPSYLINSDVCISPLKKNLHHDTTYANKIFQYMSFGQPIVASDCAAQATVVKESCCGLIHKAGDVNDFANKIKELYDNPIMRKAMGEAGKKALRQKYDWKILQKNLITLYSEQKD